MRIGYFNLVTVITLSIVILAIIMVVHFFTIAICRPRLAGGFAVSIGLVKTVVKPVVAFTTWLRFLWDRNNFLAIVVDYSLIRLNRHKRDANQGNPDEEGGGGVCQ